MVPVEAAGAPIRWYGLQIVSSISTVFPLFNCCLDYRLSLDTFNVIATYFKQCILVYFTT